MFIPYECMGRPPMVGRPLIARPAWATVGPCRNRMFGVWLSRRKARLYIILLIINGLLVGLHPGTSDCCWAGMQSVKTDTDIMYICCLYLAIWDAILIEASWQVCLSGGVVSLCCCDKCCIPLGTQPVETSTIPHINNKKRTIIPFRYYSLLYYKPYCVLGRTLG